jgi:surface antigen
VKLWDIAKDAGRKIGEFLGFIEPKQPPPALPSPGPTIPVVTAASSQTVKVVATPNPGTVTVAKTPGMNNTKVVVCKECAQPAPPPKQQPVAAPQAAIGNSAPSDPAAREEWLADIRIQVKKDKDGIPDCSPYFGKGYCTDYVKQKLGALGLPLPGGNAVAFPVTHPATSLPPPNVPAYVVFTKPGATGHVAWIESVTADSIVVSEWNWDTARPDPIDQYCTVTKSFGIPTRRTIPTSEFESRGVKGFWVAPR